MSKVDELVRATKAVRTLRATIANRRKSGWPWGMSSRKRAMAQVRGKFLSPKRPKTLTASQIINGVTEIISAEERRMDWDFNRSYKFCERLRMAEEERIRAAALAEETAHFPDVSRILAKIESGDFDA